MATEFSVMERHRESPRGPSRTGKVVLSRLQPGRSVIGARAPSVKLVLEGEELYQVGGRTIRIGPGQYLYLDAGADCIGTNRTETIGLCLMLPTCADDAPALADDGILGRAVALSTNTSRMGEALLDYAREIARDPARGRSLAPELVARVESSLAEPLAESRAA